MQTAALAALLPAARPAGAPHPQAEGAAEAFVLTDGAEPEASAEARPPEPEVTPREEGAEADVAVDDVAPDVSLRSEQPAEPEAPIASGTPPPARSAAPEVASARAVAGPRAVPDGPQEAAPDGASVRPSAPGEAPVAAAATPSTPDPVRGGGAPVEPVAVPREAAPRTAVPDVGEPSWTPVDPGSAAERSGRPASSDAAMDVPAPGRMRTHHAAPPPGSSAAGDAAPLPDAPSPTPPEGRATAPAGGVAAALPPNSAVAVPAGSARAPADVLRVAPSPSGVPAPDPATPRPPEAAAAPAGPTHSPPLGVAREVPAVPKAAGEGPSPRRERLPERQAAFVPAQNPTSAPQAGMQSSPVPPPVAPFDALPVDEGGSSTEGAVPDVEFAAAERAGAARGDGARAVQPQQSIAQVPPAQVVRQVAEAMPGRPGGPVELHLDPRELGTVRITLQSAEGVLTALVVAERPETAELMRRNAEMLETALRDAGGRSVSVDVSGGGRDPERGERPRGAAGGPAPAEAEMAMMAPRQAAARGLDLRL